METKAGVTTIKTYWPGGLGLEIDKTGQATKLMWTHVDRLGSPVSITDASGNLAEKLEYDAWGKRRSTTDHNATPNTLDGVVDNRGFTNHEMLDQLDLVHMNGRVYDPWTARFVSGDPIIQELNNGQSYNRYSYVVNSPTNLTDPTGFMRCDGNEGIGSHICGNVAANAFGGGFNGYAAQAWGLLTKQFKDAYATIKQYIAEQKSKAGDDKPNIKSQDATPSGSRAATSNSASTNNDIVQSAWASSPNRYVAEMAPCVGREGACGAAQAAPLAGGYFLGTAVGRFSLAGFGIASAPLDDVYVPGGRLTTAIAEETVVLYRGVNNSHKAFESAERGLVRANGGLATPLEHNTVPGATLRSSYTSWTTNPDVALNFALRPGGGGVVIRAEVALSKITQSANLKSVLLKQSGQIVSESEVLVSGTVRGTATKVGP